MHLHQLAAEAGIEDVRQKQDRRRQKDATRGLGRQAFGKDQGFGDGVFGKKIMIDASNHAHVAISYKNVEPIAVECDMLWKLEIVQASAF